MRLRSREGKVAHGLLAHVSTSPGRTTRGAVTAFKRTCRPCVVSTHVSYPYTRTVETCFLRRFGLSLGELLGWRSSLCGLCESARSRCSCSERSLPPPEWTAMFYIRTERRNLDHEEKRKEKEKGGNEPSVSRTTPPLECFPVLQNTCAIYRLIPFRGPSAGNSPRLHAGGQ